MTSNHGTQTNRWIILPLLAVLGGAHLPAPSQAEIWRWGRKQEQSERQMGLLLTRIDPGKNPMAQFWSSPEFVNRFMGLYGFNADIEPKMNTLENAYYLETLSPLLASDPEEAAQALRGYITKDSSALFDFLLGTYYFQKSDLTNAVSQYQAALAKFPDFRRAHQSLGFSLVRLQRYPEGAAALTRTIELGGADSNVYGLLGFCHLNMENYISAEAAYKNGMMLDPGNKDWMMGIVRCWIATEHFRPALRMMDEMLAMDPAQESLWALQAGIYLQMNQPDRAVVSLELLRKLGKADIKSLALLGDIHMMQDFPTLALPVYEEVLRRDGVADLARTLRAADILVNRGAHEEARALFARVRGLGLDNLAQEDQIKLLKMESQVAMATDQGEDAIKVLEEIILKDPLDGEALLMAGSYYGGVNELDKAFHRFDLAAKIPQFEAEAYLKQAQLLVRDQKYQQAVELLEKAQRLKPRDNVQSYLDKVKEAASRSVSS